MHRSYVSKAWLDEFMHNANIDLPTDVAARFFSVVRVKPDEEVAVFDGEGREIIGVLQKSSSGVILAGARMRCEARSLPQIIVIQAAIDEGKLEQTIQRGCEFGVDRFIIFPGERSASFCLNKITKKFDRLQRIAEDATRQSMRLYLPTIKIAPSLDDALGDVRAEGGVGVFGELASPTLFSIWLREHAHAQSLVIVVGPEGGLSPTEIKQLTSGDFTGCSWAPHVLRTELACLAPASIINAFCGRA